MKQMFKVTRESNRLKPLIVLNLFKFNNKDIRKTSMIFFQKQFSVGVLRKRCSENMQQIYKRTPMSSVISIKLQKNFIKIGLRHGCSPVNLLHIFGTPLPQNTSGVLLLVDLMSLLLTLTIHSTMINSLI